MCPALQVDSGLATASSDATLPTDNALSHQHYHHHHSHGNAASANNAFYNAHAHTYEKDIHQAAELAQSVAALILTQCSLEKGESSVLDYACGTGLLSRALSPHVHSILGVDISEGMVSQYNERAGQQYSNIRAIAANLVTSPDELKGQKFNVIVCSMAYHHFESPAFTTRALASFLQPGGTLFVVDNIKQDGNNFALTHEQRSATVTYPSGFSKSDINGMFDEAGLHQFSFVRIDHETVVVDGVEAEQFLASGTKEM